MVVNRELVAHCDSIDPENQDANKQWNPMSMSMPVEQVAEPTRRSWYKWLKFW